MRRNPSSGEPILVRVTGCPNGCARETRAYLKGFANHRQAGETLSKCPSRRIDLQIRPHHAGQATHEAP